MLFISHSSLSVLSSLTIYHYSSLSATPSKEDAAIITLLSLYFITFKNPLNQKKKKKGGGKNPFNHFIIGDWNAKVGSQETPGVTGKFGLGVQNEAGQRLIVLPRECTGHSKHPLPKTLHMDITRWPTPKSDWLNSLQPKMEQLHTVSKNKTRSWLWLRSWTPYCQIQT